MTITDNIDSDLDSKLLEYDLQRLLPVQARVNELVKQRRAEAMERLQKEAELLGATIHHNGNGKKSKRKPRAPRAQE